MKTGVTYALTVGITALSLSAAVAQISTDYDKSINFNTFKTYAWTTPDIQVGNNPIYKSGLITKNIENALSNELDARGLTMNAEKPDLLVSFHTYTEKKTAPNPTYAPVPMYYPFGFRTGWRYYPYGFGNWPYAWNNNIQQVNYTEGTLIVDIADAQSKQLIWRGSVEGNVSDPKRLEKEVDKGIHKIMKDYPVKPTKS